MRHHRSLAASAACTLSLLWVSPGAFAYSVSIDISSESRASASAGSTAFSTPGVTNPPAHYASNLPAPLTAAQDPSIDFLLPNGAYIAALGRYEATVDPGGIHIASRSFAHLDAPPLVDSHLTIGTTGTVSTSFQDDVRITLAGLPNGTPFLMTVLARVDGIVTTPFGGTGVPSSIEASASGSGFWGMTLAYSGSRPAGVPTNISNGFMDGSGGLIRADHDGVVFDEFTRNGMLGQKTLTFYGISGQQASFDMWMYLTTGAGARLGPFTIPGGTGAASVEAGVTFAFDHTFAWGGIAGVSLLDGTPVALSNVSVQSSSGFDYRNAYVNPVPEPAAASLLAGAMAALVCARRRRTR